MEDKVSKFSSIVLLILMAMSSSAATETTPPRPHPPTAEVPDLEIARPPVLCISCGEPFSIENHGKILNDLVANPFVGELRRALYVQDSLHQFESKAHFDNCDFDGGIAYIDSLLAEVSGNAEKVQHAKTDGDREAVTQGVKAAFFALGQALHAVQDFYAHSNYIELTEGKTERVAKWELIRPWLQSGRQRIAQLRGEGLVSGYVFWGVPQSCPEGTVTHGQLAKDSEATKSGTRKIGHLQNLSQFKVAIFLARETSIQLMEYAFARWPILKAENGESVAIDLLVDRRDL